MVLLKDVYIILFRFVCSIEHRKNTPLYVLTVFNLFHYFSNMLYLVVLYYCRDGYTVRYSLRMM